MGKRDKIEELKKRKKDLINEMGNLEIELYSIDKQIEEIEKHRKASARWYKNLSDDKRKIRNLKHLLKYYENKMRGNNE
jgi:hypothetical protein